MTSPSGYLDAGRASAARLILGGGRPNNFERGYFVQPTIFSDVDAGDALARGEIFGPVAMATIFDTDEQALTLANGLGYGLVAGVQRHLSCARYGARH